jgi:hypothetical protein
MKFISMAIVLLWSLSFLNAFAEVELSYSWTVTDAGPASFDKSGGLVEKTAHAFSMLISQLGCFTSVSTMPNGKDGGDDVSLTVHARCRRPFRISLEGHPPGTMFGRSVYMAVNGRQFIYNDKDGIARWADNQKPVTPEDVTPSNMCVGSVEDCNRKWACTYGCGATCSESRSPGLLGYSDGSLLCGCDINKPVELYCNK